MNIRLEGGCFYLSVHTINLYIAYKFNVNRIKIIIFSNLYSVVILHFKCIYNREFISIGSKLLYIGVNSNFHVIVIGF